MPRKTKGELLQAVAKKPGQRQILFGPRVASVFSEAAAAAAATVTATADPPPMPTATTTRTGTIAAPNCPHSSWTSR